MTRMRMGAAALMTVLGTAACASTGSMGDTLDTGAASRGVWMASDANVAAVASAANQDEIQTSQLALQRSQNARVREFAQRMITEHTGVEQQMQALLQSKGMAPRPDEHAQMAMRATQQTLAMLGGLSGAAFDRAYMEHQVAAHRWTLNSLDQSLIPATRDGEMRAMLAGQVRPAVAMHLETARQILSSVGGQAGTAAAGATNHSGMNHGSN